MSMPDHGVDSLLRQLRAELSVRPSREFMERVRAGAVSGQRLPRWSRPFALAAVATALLLGIWWTATTARPQVPALVLSDGFQRPPGVPITLERSVPRGPLEYPATASAASAPSKEGAGLAVPADVLWADASAIFEEVDLPELPVWTVEPARIAVTSVEPRAPAFTPVEFPRVEFTQVDLPPLPTAPGPSLVHTSRKEMP